MRYIFILSKQDYLFLYYYLELGAVSVIVGNVISVSHIRYISLNYYLIKFNLIFYDRVYMVAYFMIGILIDGKHNFHPL